MQLEPRQPFRLATSREAHGVAFPAEPVLGRALPDAAEEQAGRAQLSRAPRRIGRISGLSGAGHVALLAALLAWSSHVVPPQPLDPGAAVAMLFQPASPSPAAPALPPMQSLAPVPPEATAPETPQPPEAEPASAPDAPPPTSLAEATPSPLSPPIRAATPAPTAALAAPPAAVPAHPSLAAKPAPHPAPHPVREARAAPVASAPPAAAEPLGGAASSQTALLQPLVPPRPLAAAAGNPAPLYPILAERRREQGRVLLHVDVSADGRAGMVKIAVSSGSSALDHAAMAAVQQWRFVPATRGGVPVAAVAEVPVQFTLAN